MSKYNCPTSSKHKGNIDEEDNMIANCAFGAAMLTPAMEAEIDRKLGVPEAFIQKFLNSINSPDEPEIDDFEDYMEPLPEELREAI